jgi:DNA-binding NarL/FixJ family response regulator
MIHVFVVDDHPLFIDGVKTALQNPSFGIKVIDTATSGEEAIKKLIKSGSDIVLLDLKMAGMSGADCCQIMKQKFPTTKIIIVTGELDIESLYQVWNNGADAIITKNGGVDELRQIITSVSKGNRMIGKHVPDFFSYKELNEEKERPYLTLREREVLETLAKGHNRFKTSEILNISKVTVDFHCRNIFAKLEKRKLPEVLEAARKHKYLT